MAPNLFMSKREACETLRISEATLDRLIQAGKVRRVPVSKRRVVVPVEDIERILHGHDAGGGGAAEATP